MSTNDELHAATPAILNEVYRVAEGLYVMLGCTVPEGRTFARCLDEQAEYCYRAAVVAYYNVMARVLDERETNTSTH